MEKEINRLLRWLQGEFILAWMLVPVAYRTL